MKQPCVKMAVISAVLIAAPVLGYAQVNLDPYMDIGKFEYQSQCALCHGELGKGDGSFNVMQEAGFRPDRIIEEQWRCVPIQPNV